MHNITIVTRNNISNLFLNGFEDWHTGNRCHYPYCGKLNEIEFLQHFFPLKDMPSKDSRYKTFEDEIWKHRINNDDDSDNWVFEDDRFELKTCNDDKYLSFLIYIFRPEVRDETGYWNEFREKINDLLKVDGYEIYTSELISNHPVYDWRPLSEIEIQTGKFAPFSVRNKKSITATKSKISLPMKIRRQIFKLICKYNENSFIRDDETGLTYDIITKDKILVDIRAFYAPKAFNRNNVYAETNDIEEFILKSSPYSVFDAIEMFSQYNKGTHFQNELNTAIPENIKYRLLDGKLQQAKLPIIINEVIREKGLKELIEQAQSYYNTARNREDKQIAIEKIWDAFERLKTYYIDKTKPQSIEQIIADISHNNTNFIDIFRTEFLVLKDIGNKFRIRHSETDQNDIIDENYYDYLFKRCMALIELALKYLK